MLLNLLISLLALAVPDWIGWEEAFPWDVETEHSRLSARYLRTEFSLSGEPSRAVLDICGLGLYECYINGAKVGEDVLTPNPTDYRKTLLYNTYDVTEMLSEGGNALGVALGPGRFYTMQQHYKPHKIRNFGYPKLWMRLHLTYADGSEEDIVSREQGWKLTAEGPVRSANEYDGEVYDARMELGEWTRTGFDDGAWLPARRSALPDGTLRPSPSPSMRVMRSLPPLSLIRHG
ncbi:MAG: alpha-L-rhamnosidase N-terminal domain-containing protein, partial [Bacteroidales bacterium]|nr:alpha-L-rhamnosidase N-terminal domain-containing protein [Bacteroidales bacterium]